jgi:tRNA(Ile)-lysidine synthase
VDDRECDRLFERLRAYRSLVVAVSGGPDSTALMHLIGHWHRRHGSSAPTPVAVTVDHGLRPESASEAAQVGSQAATLGISHRTVRWTETPPPAGLQAAAREARYRLLAAAAHDVARTVSGPTAILTAHTTDDQAETLVMRMARGSGIDGLAAIPAHGVWEAPPLGLTEGSVDIIRPLLTVSRARLLATLAQQEIAFVEDPTNRDRRFERVRIREALTVLETLGVSREALARSAGRLRDAREALEKSADAFEARSIRMHLDLVHEIERDAFAETTAETATRILRRILARAGGAARPPELIAVEEAAARLRAGERRGETFTIGGCIVDCARKNVRIYREPARGGGLHHLRLTPGERVLWDNRFWAEAAAGLRREVEIGPLGEDWASLRADHPALATLDLPAAAAHGMPVFREARRIVSAPLLADAARALGDRASADALEGACHSGTDLPADWKPVGLHLRPAWRAPTRLSPESALEPPTEG